MIVIRYKGGLGNQMFQYAFQMAMQKRYPDEAIKADISHYRLQKEHNGFELERCFGVSLDYASQEEVRKLTNLYVAPDWVLQLPEKMKKRIADKYQYKISGWKRKLCKEKEQNYYRCRYHNSYEEVVFHLNLDHDWYLDGLWQNLNYYTDCRQEIQEAFSFLWEGKMGEADRGILNEIRERNSISVHVRRGDFVNSKFDICTRQYYDRAMGLMECMAGAAEPLYYYFFTDDAVFVEREFADIKNKKVIMHGAEDSILDLQMMNACRNHIISNSTFAYWAAYLHKGDRGIIVAPRYSIRNATGAYELSAPEEWVLVEV